MRVISGKYKSRKIKTLKGDNTRPTADKIKGAIFSSIAFDVKPHKMLDLFSGSGAMGIEALSRGFSYVYFNDIDKKAVNIIKANLKELELLKQSRVYNLDYKDVIKHVSKEAKIDFIFIDPPYDKIDIEDILACINKYEIVADQGILCIETASHTVLLDTYDNLIKYKEKKYKATTIAYFRKGE